MGQLRDGAAAPATAADSATAAGDRWSEGGSGGRLDGGSTASLAGPDDGNGGNSFGCVAVRAGGGAGVGGVTDGTIGIDGSFAVAGGGGSPLSFSLTGCLVGSCLSGGATGAIGDAIGSVGGNRSGRAVVGSSERTKLTGPRAGAGGLPGIATCTVSTGAGLAADTGINTAPPCSATVETADAVGTVAGAGSGAGMGMTKLFEMPDGGGSSTGSGFTGGIMGGGDSY